MSYTVLLAEGQTRAALELLELLEVEEVEDDCLVEEMAKRVDKECKVEEDEAVIEWVKLLELLEVKDAKDDCLVEKVPKRVEED